MPTIGKYVLSSISLGEASERDVSRKKGAVEGGRADVESFPETGPHGRN